MAVRSAEQLRHDALAIWQAGLEAVRAERLMEAAMRLEGDTLWIDEQPVELARVRKIAVVGAGKAGAGMAAALEQILGPRLSVDKQLTGWINVPADCVRTLSHIQLHAARPAGRNEPTQEGVHGTEQILRMVAGLHADDLCLCLISGGGSALLPAPVDGLPLADKLAVTQFLSSAGANITQLNTVRKQLSRVKAGGLARACRAGQLISLIISDVMGDPLDVIASGPTVIAEDTDSATAAQAAMAVLNQFDPARAHVPATVRDILQKRAFQQQTVPPLTARVTNLVIGNNAVAVDAAGLKAESLGYSHAMVAARGLEGAAEEVGRHLASMALRMRGEAGPDCLISGGEPVVTLPAGGEQGKGGRNQQLALAALETLSATGSAGIALVAGGTDGEDGPTDAAGAWCDAGILQSAISHRLNGSEYLKRCDAYHFFEVAGGLLKTGPTHTNVCDLRVVVVDRVETASR